MPLGVIHADKQKLNNLVISKFLFLISVIQSLKEVKITRKLVVVRKRYSTLLTAERGDVPGWVLVVLMTTGLVTAIWTIAAPRLSAILRNSLDSMNNVR